MKKFSALFHGNPTYRDEAICILFFTLWWKKVHYIIPFSRKMAETSPLVVRRVNAKRILSHRHLKMAHSIVCIVNIVDTTRLKSVIASIHPLL